MGYRISALALSMLLGSVSGAQAYYLTDEAACSPVDLRQVHPMLVRDQGNVSWCYAHSAADYLQFYFRLPTQISAADIALQYGRRAWPRFLRWIQRDNISQTGFARSAMWDALANGYCPEESFPSDHWTKRYLSGEKQGQTEPVKIGTAIKELVALREQLRMGLYHKAAELPFTYDFKGVSAEQVFAVLGESTALSLATDLRDVACEGHRVEFPREIGAIGMRLKGRNTFVRINSVLDTKTPVSIDYFYGVLENRDSFKHSLAELHSTLLMGRRYDAAEGECKYLIKNSFGAHCRDRYDPRNECEGGYLWVTESALYRAIVSYVYIKDPLTDDSGPDLRTESVPGSDHSDLH
jgi:hypothetical protein